MSKMLQLLLSRSGGFLDGTSQLDLGAQVRRDIPDPGEAVGESSTEGISEC